MKIGRTYHFESAHHLPLVEDGHKCKRLHGHNYRMDVVVVGDFDSRGFIIDFWDLDKIVQPLIDLVDHRLLNDVSGLENPTAERIAQWFFNRISTAHQGCGLVRIWETPECWAEYGWAT